VQVKYSISKVPWPRSQSEDVNEAIIIATSRAHWQWSQWWYPFRGNGGGRDTLQCAGLRRMKAALRDCSCDGILIESSQLISPYPLRFSKSGSPALPIMLLANNFPVSCLCA
jgi:hypothetical protein